jgi:hypothetical protein
MRSLALVALAALVGACSGAGDSEPNESAGPAVLDVTIVDSGERRLQVFRMSGGVLSPLKEGGLGQRRVFSRAGSEPDRQGIIWEEIYLIEPDGTRMRLTNDRRADLAPQLLRDGRVAFLSCTHPEDGTSPACALVAIDPERRERAVLLDDLGIVFDGELSRDERRYLFTRLDDSARPAGLFARALDGGGERRQADGYGGTWSPAGRRIAFVSDRDENGRCLFHDCTGFAGEIYVADADGGGEERLTDNPQTDSSPEWSGDGEWIVFARIPEEEDDWDLHAVRADGKCERQLTDTPRWEVGAAWHGAGHGGLSC